MILEITSKSCLVSVIPYRGLIFFTTVILEKGIVNAILFISHFSISRDEADDESPCFLKSVHPFIAQTIWPSLD